METNFNLNLPPKFYRNQMQQQIKRKTQVKHPYFIYLFFFFEWHWM